MFPREVALSSQFLQVTVVDVMATPLGDGIELDAVRELHGFAFKNATVFPSTLLLPLGEGVGRG